MSVENAMTFLREARHDEALVRALEELDGKATWESLVGAAAQAGFPCTVEELQRAHVLDWGLRWARYNGSKE